LLREELPCPQSTYVHVHALECDQVRLLPTGAACIKGHLLPANNVYLLDVTFSLGGVCTGEEALRLNLLDE